MPRRCLLSCLLLVATHASGCMINCRSIVPTGASLDHVEVVDGPGDGGNRALRRMPESVVARRALESVLAMLVMLVVILPGCVMWYVHSPVQALSRRRTRPNKDTRAPAAPGALGPAPCELDLFVLYAAADAEFVRGYLIPALDLPSCRVLLVGELTPGALIVSEIDRAVSRSRFTVAVLSPAYLADVWAMFGAQLVSYLSVQATRVIPLRLAGCELPVHLQARVALDFTDRASWASEIGRLRVVLCRAGPCGIET